MQVLQASDAETEYLLATLPARLDPAAAIAPLAVWTPLRASLLAAWLIVLAAFAALLLLVRASLRLSERRATFVSAVTHELRTPLTTFRMYTQMLVPGYRLVAKTTEGEFLYHADERGTLATCAVAARKSPHEPREST